MTLDEGRSGELNRLANRLGRPFNDIHLLNKALTHRSWANECADPNVPDNERFEFLGDAVLDLIVAEVIVAHEQKFREGRLSRIRAQVVNEQALADTARTLGIGGYLLLGKGEINSGGREKPSLLANAMEAVIAAVYVDGGYGPTRDIFLPIFAPRIDAAIEGLDEFDHKGKLQRLLKGALSPSYRLVGEEGPDHAKEFTVALYLNDKRYGGGSGRTKKEAEQHAAREACVRLEAEQRSAETEQA